MKIKSFAFSYVTGFMLLMYFMPPVSASRQGHFMVPGRSDGGLKLGSRRDNSQKDGKPDKTYHFSWNIITRKGSSRVNLVEDEWDRENGTDTETIEVLYAGGRVIQIQEHSSYVSTKNGISPGTSRISDITREYKHLESSAYSYDSIQPNGQPGLGGSDLYLYDDKRQGIAFYFSTQEGPYDEIIEGIIVHRAGYPAIPSPGGARVKRIEPEPKLTLPYLYHHQLSRGNTP